MANFQTNPSPIGFPLKKAAPLGWPFWNFPISCSQVTGVFASMYQALKSMWALHVAALSYEFQAARGIDGIQIAEPQGLRGRWWQGLDFFPKTLESQPRFSCILTLYMCHNIYVISNVIHRHRHEGKTMSPLHGFIPSTQKKHKLKTIYGKSIPKLLNETISKIRNVQDAVVTHLKLPLNRWDLNLFISYLMSQNCHSGDNF